MRASLYQIDAFTGRLFGGNPAAVVPLEAWLADETLQAIAEENNLSETAFLVGGDGRYRIRWFTPATEVDLCGHATLAAAHVVFTRLESGRSEVGFDSASGPLRVTREGELLALDFPARPPLRGEVPGLAEALAAAPVEVYTSARDLMAVFDTEAEVGSLEPDMERLASFGPVGIIVTAPGDSDADFVSRFFAPALGIPEDPVTGSAHSVLAPYWAGRLGKTKLAARQISSRGGELVCELRGERVAIAGRVAEYLEGTIRIGEGA